MDKNDKWNFQHLRLTISGVKTNNRLDVVAMHPVQLTMFSGPPEFVIIVLWITFFTWWELFSDNCTYSRVITRSSEVAGNDRYFHCWRDVFMPISFANPAIVWVPQTPAMSIPLAGLAQIHPLYCIDFKLKLRGACQGTALSATNLQRAHCCGSKPLMKVQIFLK